MSSLVSGSGKNLLRLSFLSLLFLGACAHLPESQDTRETTVTGTGSAQDPIVEPTRTGAESTEPSAESADEPVLNGRDVVIGYVETFRVVPDGVQVNARMDTGATTSSINAQEISRFERDGRPWVRFDVVDEATDEIKTLERPLARSVRIRQHVGDPDERYVVELEIYLGDRHLKGEFTLADRSNFTYKGLLGRNLLEEGYLVDSSTTNLLGQPRK